MRAEARSVFVSLQDLHAHLDVNSLLYVQLFSYDLKYTPTKKNDAPGKLGALSVVAADVMAWAVVPLFEKWVCAVVLPYKYINFCYNFKRYTSVKCAHIFPGNRAAA